jgi:hypothetical protein
VSLHLHSAACEAYLTEPPEYEDPLLGVDFPRDRKPWKRDRYAIRSAMNGAINHRCWDNTGEDGRTRDHSQRFAFLNMAHFEIDRFRWESRKGKHQAWRDETIARLRRYVLAACRFDVPPLPCRATLATEEPGQ